MILVAAILYGCVEYENKKFDDVPYVNVNSVELYIGAGAPESRKSLQLVSSPSGKQYVWTSLVPGVATVSQSGLITAVAEGFSEITIASENHTTSVSVRVRKWVPLESFTLGAASLYVNFNQRLRLLVIPEPVDASEVNVKWTSSRPDICPVIDNGWITFWGDEGESAIITATVEGLPPVEKLFKRLKLLDRSTWSFPGTELPRDGNRGTYGFSTSHWSDGGGIASMLDENNGTYWHTAWGSPNSNYPQWFIADLGDEAVIDGVVFRRRQGDARGNIGYWFFTYKEAGDLPTDGSNSPPWFRDDNNTNKMGGVDNWRDYWQQHGSDWPFNPNTDDEQTNYMDEENLPVGRYLLFYFNTNHRGGGNNVMISKFKLYGNYVN